MLIKSFIFVLVFYSITFADSPVIKSLRAFNSRHQSSAPVISHGEKLTIEFDISADFMPDMAIVFRYCDRHWKPVKNIFLDNTGFNIDFNLDYEIIPFADVGANYFFSHSYPDEDVTFPYSGKWKFYLTDSQDTSLVYASGKFIAAYPKTFLDSRITKRRYEGRTLKESTLGQTFRIFPPHSIAARKFFSYRFTFIRV